jgi:GNAT superfamily N-acetyltransferase
MDLNALTIRPLTREEFDLAIDWAAEEGWNPGLNDAEVFWHTDPDGYLGAEYHGDLVATGSIVSYGTAYGFMGFFIVKLGLRGLGIGTKLWHHRRDLLKSRLGPEAAIGMDGVFDMQQWYGRGGFEYKHHNLRMKGVGKTGRIQSEIVPLSQIPYHQLSDYDKQCFGCPRDRFLKQWTNIPNALALGFVSNNDLSGYGVIRECHEGYKIGALFSDNAEIAESLFVALSNHAADQPIFLDTPEINTEAMALAARQGMREVFGCARMYYEPL